MGFCYPVYCKSQFLNIAGRTECYMSRLPCCSIVEREPICHKFIPETKEAENERKIIVYVEELEAIRLKDLYKLDQLACANRMKISRGTFQRILQSGRQKIATALIHGKTIVIQGEHYRLKE